MTLPAIETRRPFAPRIAAGSVSVPWLVALAVFAVLWLAPVPAWIDVYPKTWEIPAARSISAAMKWLVNEASFGLFTFTEFTRFLASIIEAPYRLAMSLLATGFLSGQGSSAVQVAPPLSWIAVIGIVALMGHAAGGRALALLVFACFVFILVFGQWQSAMATLASVLVAVPIGVVGGLLLGIAAYRHPRFEQALTPVLDVMQTVPAFAYLVPILFLFGFGPTAAILATVIYALPPMARITALSLRQVAPEIRDLGRMVGATRHQMTWRVLVPSARDSLMVGVNQVIMLSLNMVIIASMIGAGGLGFDVLAALRRLDIGAGLEAGLAIVALAVALDRLSQAFAQREASALPDRGSSWSARHPHIAAGLALVVATYLVGLLLPAIRTWPEAWEISTGAYLSEVVKWININFFDMFEAVKNAILLNLLIPFKRLLGDLPWLGVTGLLAVAGWRLGGVRLMATVAILSFLIAATGQWEKAMVTVYLCGISVLFAALIGIPVGILCAENDRVWRAVSLVIDTLQTLPSFVYLMPVVMLFRVGDFSAMIAVVAYAVVPAIRYTVLGLTRVDPRVIEAGRAMGATRGQILSRIRLKLALPEILLGINQTIMFALSMLVITALVGTRDLGQEVYIALTKADTGRGLVAGLAVAAIAIVADRLISAGAARTRARLGLADTGGSAS